MYRTQAPDTKHDSEALRFLGVCAAEPRGASSFPLNVIFIMFLASLATFFPRCAHIFAQNFSKWARFVTAYASGRSKCASNLADIRIVIPKSGAKSRNGATMALVSRRNVKAKSQKRSSFYVRKKGRHCLTFGGASQVFRNEGEQMPKARAPLGSGSRVRAC